MEFDVESMIGDPPPVDERFAAPAPEALVDRCAEALSRHGFTVEIVDWLSDACDVVERRVPQGAQVYTVVSSTLADAGIDELINSSGRYDSVRARQALLDITTQRDDMRRLLSNSDWVIGSVNAVTSDGALVVASSTGSQLGLYARGAGHLIYVVGSQKIVANLEDAVDRVFGHAFPKEHARAMAAYGHRSAINKLLIVNAEYDPERTTVVLVREAAGV